jgi:membrane protease YdiL (CAAX protease family)
MTITTAITPSGSEDPVVATPIPPDERELPQLSRRQIAKVWAAAALPMAALSWIVAPILARSFSGEAVWPRALLISLTFGVVWQGVLVLVLVVREQGSLRWPVLREALWLRAPRSPKSGRTGGRVWWVVLPLMLLMTAEEMLTLPVPGMRDIGEFFQSSAAEQFFHGAWGWYGLLAVMAVFNTFLGEELLFRGYLLPRMNGAFGRWDWLANGVLFGFYHLHTPWVIPASVCDAFVLAYPTKRYRSAWIGIAVHSAQSVFILIAGLALVL